jgi:hypothetical protein
MSDSKLTESLELIIEEAKRHRADVEAAEERLFKLFVAAVPEVFKAFPTITTFGWREGSLAFNDGDPCPFQVYSDEEDIYVDGLSGYDDKYGDGDGELDEGATSTKEERNAARKAISDLVSCVPESVFEGEYDQGRVTCYRDGKIETEWCDFD